MRQKLKAKVASALSAATSTASSAPVAYCDNGDVPVHLSKRLQQLSPSPLIQPKDAASLTEAKEPLPPLLTQAECQVAIICCDIN
eukprot:2645982-Ditylum_brightwellii.AAC.1